MIRPRLFALASLAATTFTAFSTPSICEAQIVRFGGFGGVQVRAPFVSVDVGPYGAARVAAPFTSIYSLGPRVYGPSVYGPRVYRPGVYGPRIVGVPAFPPIPPFGVVPAIPAFPAPVIPVVPVPVVPEPVGPEMELAIPPSGYQVTRPSIDGHVSEDLRRAAIRLQYSLSLRHDGDVWLDYLGPARIVAVIEQGQSPDSLRDLVANYDGVVANSKLRAIYSAGGFNETRELLRVYVDMKPLAAPQQLNPVPPPSEIPSPPRPSEQAAPEPLPAPQPTPKEETPAPPAPDPPGPAAEPTEL